MSPARYLHDSRFQVPGDEREVQAPFRRGRWDVRVLHSPKDLLGWALLYARHARVNIERDRLWEAEYYATGFRNYALSVACAHRNLPALYGKGLEDLPRDVVDSFQPALVRSFDRDELSRALEAGLTALSKDLRRDKPLDPKLQARIDELIAPSKER